MINEILKIMMPFLKRITIFIMCCYKSIFLSFFFSMSLALGKGSSTFAAAARGAGICQQDPNLTSVLFGEPFYILLVLENLPVSRQTRPSYCTGNLILEILMHIQLINTLIPALQNIPEIYTKNEFSPKKSVSCSAFF